MNERNFCISVQDAVAYANYCHFCGVVGVAPLTLREFLLLTEKWVSQGWDSYARRINLRAVNETKPRARVNDHRVHDALQQGFVVGELREDGTVHPVRPDIDSISEEGVVLLSPVTARVCWKCKRFLPAISFSKKRGTIRNVCKKCDSRAVVEQRRKRTAESEIRERMAA